MRYIFEKGQYPKLISQEEREFTSDEEAIAYAKDNDIDYVWSCPEDSNPNEVYRKLDDTRCTSVWKCPSLELNGKRCELSVGHRGSHLITMTTTKVVHQWYDTWEEHQQDMPPLPNHLQNADGSFKEQY